MKIKFWQFEYDFDKDDAKIVIPVILLLIAIITTRINPALLIGVAAIYYFLYFFSGVISNSIISIIPKPKLKCPRCRNRKIILQGYDTYKSDEYYPYYLCTGCGTTSVLTQGGLLDVNKAS